MSIGLYIGRFQPFHLGHLSAIKQALSHVDILIIGIGSAQYSNTTDNPFTAEERAKMIESALLENGINKDQFKIIPIPDIHNNAEWPAHVQKLTGDFDMVFVSEEALVKELFETHTDIPIKMVKKEVNICATDIRKMIKEGDEWKKHVPNSCTERIDKNRIANN